MRGGAPTLARGTARPPANQRPWPRRRTAFSSLDAPTLPLPAPPLFPVHACFGVPCPLGASRTQLSTPCFTGVCPPPLLFAAATRLLLWLSRVFVSSIDYRGNESPSAGTLLFPLPLPLPLALPLALPFPIPIPSPSAPFASDAWLAAGAFVFPSMDRPPLRHSGWRPGAACPLGRVRPLPVLCFSGGTG